MGQRVSRLWNGQHLHPIPKLQLLLVLLLTALIPTTARTGDSIAGILPLTALIPTTARTGESIAGFLPLVKTMSVCITAASNQLNQCKQCCSHMPIHSYLVGFLGSCYALDGIACFSSY